MSDLRVNTLRNASGQEVYTCKAWVNFNGTGTVAIRASGNVSSITDNGTGDYTVNFSNAMADANYSVYMTAMRNSTVNDATNPLIASPFGNPTYSNAFTSSGIRMQVQYTNALTRNDDGISICLSIFR
jgi:hypothetical protein